MMTRRINFLRNSLGPLFSANRRVACALALTAAVFVALSNSAWAEGFVSGFEDLPLAPGLQEKEGSLLAFETPQGRIMTVEAQGVEDQGLVKSFYLKTLPQLGWTRSGDLAFTREGEELTIAFPSSSDPGGGPPYEAHFKLTPQK